MSRATPREPLQSAQHVARIVILGWALLRVGVSAVHGLDFEGFVALVVVVSCMAALLERPRPSPETNAPSLQVQGRRPGRGHAAS
jgi:hypothetical protein